jgi:NADH-quinone oxidoreductase subunit M
VTHHIKLFMVAQLLIEATLLAAFTVLDLLLFYVSFEAVLVPLFLLVGF